MKRQLLIVIFLVAAARLTACSGGSGKEDAAQDDASADGAGDDGGGVETEDPGGPDIEREELERDELNVTRVEPDHGPFTGETQVVVRGRGFEEGAAVYFGEHMVQPAYTVVIDDNRIGVLTPAGAPGSVDVRVVLGGEEAVREDGYLYDTFYVDPPSGSIAGGTYVEIHGSGTMFEAGGSIFFDGTEAADVDWVSSTLMTCRTPAGFVGLANVEVEGEEETVEVKEAYTYFNSYDPINGGLGGGPITGSVNVTVLNSSTDNPEPGVFCILGADGETAYQGLTDDRGQITFSGPDLSGRQEITASKEGFESTSIIKFDATDVTIFLYPLPDPEPGPLPPPVLGAMIYGELVFEHSGELGPGPWEIIPDPGENEMKIAYVYTTGSSIWYSPPNPGLSGAEPIVEEDFENTGDHGFKFSVYSSPNTVAVWALAGIKNLATDTFVPYAFGVARSIIAGPGEVIEDVLVYVVHDLIQPVTVELQEYYPPLDTTYGPRVYRSNLYIDLGGDGVIFRKDRTILKEDVSDFFYPGWLPLRYELADASYTVMIGAYTPAVDALTGQTIYTNPYTVKILSSITHPWEPVVARDFIGIPYPVDPAYGSRITDMHMEFGNDGAEPDFWLVLIQSYPDQLPLWRVVLEGSQTGYDLPDLAEVAGLPEPPSGYNMWIVYGISIPGFVFDEFSYRHLSQKYWSAYSADAFIFDYQE